MRSLDALMVFERSRMASNTREKVLRALRLVSDVIECTYGHDPETNERDDGDPKCSGADIVQMLCDIEDDVEYALSAVETEGATDDVEKG